MDTYPVSGCKLLRSCFYLVMQLNQNQFYCSDPIGNLLISFYFTFCLVTVLGSFVSSLLVTFWSYTLLYLPKNTGIRRLQFSAIAFSLQSFSWWSIGGHKVPRSLQSCTLFRAGVIKNTPMPWFPEQNSPRQPAVGLCCAENLSLQLLHLAAFSSCSFCFSLSVNTIPVVLLVASSQPQRWIWVFPGSPWATAAL